MGGPGGPVHDGRGVGRVADFGLATSIAERVLELPGSRTGLAWCGGDWWTGGGGRQHFYAFVIGENAYGNLQRTKT